MDMRRLTAALQEGELGQSQLETGQAFKSAALAITTLLRVSQQSTAKAYDAGYNQCLKDVRQVLQSGLDGNSVQGLFNWLERRSASLQEQDDSSEEETPPPTAPTTQQQPSSAPTSPRPSPPVLPIQSDFQFSFPVPSTSAAPPSSARQKTAKRSSRANREAPTETAASVLGVKRKSPAEVLTVLSEGPEVDMTGFTMDGIEGWPTSGRATKRVARR